MVTNTVRYMKKAGEYLKCFYPKMIHVTCVVHGLHRIAETIRENNKLIDKLISNVKKDLLKLLQESIFLRN